MKNRKILLPILLSVALILSLILPASVAGASVTVHRPDDRSISHLVVDSSSAASAMALNTPQGQVTPMVAAGGSHIVGLKDDGTVVAVGLNNDGQCEVSNWTDIVQVAAGEYHTVGRKADGTVTAVGDNIHGQCEVDDWTDIIRVAAGGYHTVGLKDDGTVVAAGGFFKIGLEDDGTAVAVDHGFYGQCNVGNWTDIVQVAAGGGHTVGLKGDGTVVAVGDNFSRQCNVGVWTDIIQVAAGGSHTVGLKGDGTVVAVGDNDYGQLDVGVWTDIVQVAAGRSHTTGLKSDGTVVAAGPEIALAKWNLGVIEYVLTISSTAGGSVATPDEGVFTYNAGVMVRVVAEPEAGYRFVNWSGDVDTIARVSAAITIITIHGDYSITANFEEKPPINWLLIGGIIAAVVIVGLVIFLVRRKRAT